MGKINRQGQLVSLQHNRRLDITSQHVTINSTHPVVRRHDDLDLEDSTFGVRLATIHVRALGLGLHNKAKTIGVVVVV